MKKFSIQVASICLLVLSLTKLSFSQSFTLAQFPVPLQFVPRDTRDSAIVPVSGSIQTSGFDSVYVTVFKNGILTFRYATRLVYNGGTAPFLLQPKIHSELSEYRLQLFVKNNSSSILLASRDSIVCGDVFLINGQSNSWPANGAATYVNEFCRGFGRSTGYAAYDPADTAWGLARATGFSNYLAHIGVWGLRLQQLIKETYAIPICILNGGSGGSSIEYNLPNDANLTDLNTTYGRLLYRARKAGVADHVKAILWHQGESNTNTTWVNYATNFNILSQAWHRDYPGIQKVYVFQIHQGCGGTNQNELREVQRNFYRTYPDLEIMSTMGIPGHDGCHYNLQGYQQMSLQIFKQVARDFYNSKDDVDINPPNVKRAFYSTPAHAEIKLVFDRAASLSWPPDTLGQNMINYFYLDGNFGSVVSGSARNDTIALQLSAPGSATKITYLPNIYNNNTTTIYEGPWIRNSTGIGALSFFEFPINYPPSGPPVLIMPVNGAKNHPVTVVLEWHAVKYAKSYHLQVSTSPSFAAPVMDIIGIADTNHTTSNLDHDVQYFWRVRAENEVAVSDWSGVWNFTTIIDLPAIPILTAPMNGALNQPRTLNLQWSPAPRASGYHLQVAADSLFQNLIQDIPQLANNSFTLSALSFDKKYYWRVNAKNIAGTSDWSAQWNFTTVVQAPAMTQLLSPMSGAINQYIPITLRWRASDRAAQYHFQIALDSLFTSIVVDETFIDTSGTITSLLYVTKYFWRVKAINAGGESEWSDVWNFATVIQNPSTTILLSPTHRANNQSISLLLRWISSERASTYRIQLSTDSTFGAALIDASSISDTTYAITNLYYDIKYFWRVRGLNDGGTSDWSEIWNFKTILEAPSSFTLLSPSNGSQNQSVPLRFEWNASPRAASYHIRISRDVSFTSIIVDDSILSSTVYQSPVLFHDETYFWHVRAKNVGGISPWSDVWSFTTTASFPVIPELFSPANGIISQPLTLTLRWNPSDGGKNYRVQISTDSLFVSSLIIDSVVTNSAMMLQSLIPATTYYWRVRAMNSLGSSSWSAIWNFRTQMAAPAIPSLSFPVNNSINQSITPICTWNSSERAMSYHVQVSNDILFAAPVVDQPAVGDTFFNVRSLNAGTTYYWRVRALNDGGASIWSTVWSFTTIPPIPAAPILQSPANSSSNQPMTLSLQWIVTERAERYRVQVAIDQSFTSLILHDSTITTNMRSIGPLLPSTTQYWRVNASNASGASAWSDVWQFTTGNVTAVDVLGREIPERSRLRALYPNPLSLKKNPDGIVTMLFDSGAGSDLTLRVYNVFGEIVITRFSQTLKLGQHALQWSVAQLESGIYYVSVQTENSILTKTFIVIR